MTREPRNTLPLLLILYTLLAFHVTLWPYNFRFDPGFTSKRIPEISWFPEITEANRGTVVRDVALNTWFFIPFGALVFLTIRPGGRGDDIGRRLVLSLGAGLLVSTVIETAQIWLPRRFPSTTDIFSDTSGTLIGAGIAAGILRVRTVAGPERVRNAFRRNLPFIAFAAYCLALLAAAVHTMDPVDSYFEFAARAKTYLWGPSRIPFDPILAAGPFLAAAVLSLLFAYWAARAFPFLTPAVVFLGTVGLCGTYMLGLESLVVLFRSRTPSRVDSAAAVLGIAYGAALNILLRRIPGDDSRFPLVPAITLAHYALLALYVFLVPFDFAVSHFHLDRQSLIPLHYLAVWSDYSTPFFLLRPVAACLPPGFALAYWFHAAGRPVRPARISAWAALVQALVETGRAFTSSRHPGTTSVLLAGFAAFAGARLFLATLSWEKTEGAASPPETAPETTCRAQDGPP